jgi:hypothetical protein
MTVSGISNLIESAAPDLEDEGFQALDTIHDALQSSMFDAGEPEGCLVTPWSEVKVEVLLAFWTTATPPDDYWTARFEQIKQSEFARLICSGLLERQLDIYQYFDHHMPGSCVLLTRFLLEEYSCESQGVCNTSWSLNSWSLNGHAYSWAFSGRSNEKEEMTLLTRACAKLAALSDHHTRTESSEDHRDILLATLDAKQVFVGGETWPSNQMSRSLGIALPLQHVVCGHKTVFPSSFKRMRANLRLTCFKDSLARVIREAHTKKFFDLSVRSTSYILGFCTDIPKTSNHQLALRDTTIVFTGTLQQREECFQLITQEVWQNADNQLDAWSQLCVLACVKKSFSEYWKIVASDDGSEAGKIANDSNSDSCSTSSESPQQPTRPSSPYSASPSKHPSAKAQLHLQPDP